MERLKNEQLTGLYGKTTVLRMRRLIHEWMPVKGKHVVVVGSSQPWVEVILLAEGAANITTIEYNPYISNHPKINMMSPMTLAEQVKAGKAPLYDALVTFSSLEHSGLGR